MGTELHPESVVWDVTLMKRVSARGVRFMSRSRVVRSALRCMGVSLALVASSASAQVPVSLGVVLAHADEHAPALIAARARLEEGDAARSGAERLLSDPLSVEISGGPRVTDMGASDFDLALSLMQPLEVGGERGLRLAAADALGARREAELEAARWRVRREVRSAYHSAVVAMARVEMATRSRELTDRLAEIARRRAESGDVGALEHALVRADSARARQEHIEALDELQRARLEIAALAGWSAEDPPAPLPDRVSPAAAPSVALLVERASAEHPWLRVLEADLAEQRARAELADREALPTLDLGLSFAREGSAGSPANYIGLLVVGVGIPVWNANAAERALSRAAVRVAEARLAASRQALEARVRQALGTVQAAGERVRIFESEVLPELEASLALVLEAYRLGELDAVQVGTVSRRLLEVQTNAIEARADYHRALSELESQIGGEIPTAEPPAPAPPR